MLTGVVEVGLFCHMARAAYFGNAVRIPFYALHSFFSYQMKFFTDCINSIPFYSFLTSYNIGWKCDSEMERRQGGADCTRRC